MNAGRGAGTGPAPGLGRESGERPEPADRPGFDTAPDTDSGRRPGVLRRNVGPVLLAVGAFLSTLALLLNAYVYPSLALLPGDVETVWRLEDPSATYLDTATWQTRKQAEVAQRIEIRGSVAPGNDRWSTWEMSVETASSARMLTHQDRRVIVNRSTGMAVNCCGEHVDGDRAVRQAGLVLEWPASATAGDYPFYDADLRSAPLMRFEGTDEVAGVPARRYVQHVEATQVPGSARSVPAKVLGRRGGVVQATRWLELTRTLWIEPVSGRLVNASEQRRETLRGASGSGEKVLLDAELEMPDAQVRSAAALAGSLSLRLTAVRTWLPIGLGSLGAVLLLTGLTIALVQRSRDRRRAEEAEAEEDEPAEHDGDRGDRGDGHAEQEKPSR